MESNEYSIYLIANNFTKNSDLNILLKKDDSQLVAEVTNSNCNIVKNIIITKKNQQIYNDKLKKYRNICFISIIVIMLFPTYFLIISLIYKKYDISLMTFGLELLLIIMIIILSIKTNDFNNYLNTIEIQNIVTTINTDSNGNIEDITSTGENQEIGYFYGSTT